MPHGTRSFQKWNTRPSAPEGTSSRFLLGLRQAKPVHRAQGVDRLGAEPAQSQLRPTHEEPGDGEHGQPEEERDRDREERERPGTAQVELAGRDPGSGEREEIQEGVLTEQGTREQVGRVAEERRDQQPGGDAVPTQSDSDQHQQSEVGTPGGGYEGGEHALHDECRNAVVKHRDHEIMLIAHSMGTIISYNVLRDIGKTDKDFKVPYFVTIGSPLGLSHVKNRIKEDRKKARSPSIVTERWVNLSDRRDPVAFDMHLRDDFGPNTLGVRVVDDLVLNDYDYEKHQGQKSDPNPHKSYGYLRTPEMSHLIAEFLAS